MAQVSANSDPEIAPLRPQFPLSAKKLWLTALCTGVIAAAFQLLISSALSHRHRIEQATWDEFHQVGPPAIGYELLTLFGLIDNYLWMLWFGVAIAVTMATSISIRYLHQPGMKPLTLLDHVVASHWVALFCVAPVFIIALHFPSLHPELQSIVGAIVAAAYVGIIGATSIYTHFPLLWLLAWLHVRRSNRRQPQPT